MTDRHACRLCFRRFSSGRALGGHMRCHLSSSSKPTLQHPEFPSSSSSSAAALGDEAGASEQVADLGDQGGAALATAGGEHAPRRAEEDVKQLVYYGLRENPRKSCRLADPEFSFANPMAPCGVAGGLLQDRESETESSRPSFQRRRSKRRRRSLPIAKSEPSVEPEPVSSISDATPEEDVARCLMLLSREAWENSSSPAARSRCTINPEETVDAPAGEEEEKGVKKISGDDSDEELVVMATSKQGGRSRFQCRSCRKVFRSYQALGGHMASHKKIRPRNAVSPAPTPASPGREEKDGFDDHMDTVEGDVDSEVNTTPSTGSGERRIHECPVCFQVFGSGQALGGHKRSHVGYPFVAGDPATVEVIAIDTTPASVPPPAKAARSRKFVFEGLIDLNMPPPIDDEDNIGEIKLDRSFASPIC